MNPNLVVSALVFAIPLLWQAKVSEAQPKQSLAEQVDGLLAPLYAADKPGAAALISQDGNVVFRKGYGLANLEYQAPVTPETVFRLASVTKVFTATAVMKLGGETKLRMEDTVSSFMPDYGGPAAAVTVRQLLTHTSGIPEYLDRPDIREWIRKEHPVAELIDSFKERPLDFQPGAACAYSNSNYVLLGAILEKVTGKAYAELLQSNQFTPAGMHSARYDGTDEIIPGRAAGYDPIEGGYRNEKFYDMSVLYAAGGVISSADDLNRWAQALMEGRFISPETLRRSLIAPRLTDGSRGSYGAGWQLEQVGKFTAGMCGGEIPGFRHYVLILPEKRLFVALLTNRPEEGYRPGLLVLQMAQMALDDGT